MSHKFSLGQPVVFTPAPGEMPDIVTTGTVTRLLPKEGGEYQYHIQVDPDGLQRRVRESQLRSVTQ
jgi:hypothetical protein